MNPMATLSPVKIAVAEGLAGIAVALGGFVAAEVTLTVKANTKTVVIFTMIMIYI